MPDLTREEVEGMLERAEAATDGPWEDHEDWGVHLEHGSGRLSVDIESVTWDCAVIQADYHCDCIDEVEQARDDVEFIKRARDDLPRLARSWLEMEAEVRRVRGERDTLRRALLDLMASSDCEWEERNHGHDWRDAVEHAREVLGIHPGGL